MTIYTCMHLEVKSWCKSWNQWMNSGLFCQISIHSGHIHISISQHSPPVHCSVFMSFCECLCVLEVHLGHLFYFLSSLKTILIEMFLEYSKSIWGPQVLLTHFSFLSLWWWHQNKRNICCSHARVCVCSLLRVNRHSCLCFRVSAPATLHYQRKGIIHPQLINGYYSVIIYSSSCSSKRMLLFFCPYEQRRMEKCCAKILRNESRSRNDTKVSKWWQNFKFGGEIFLIPNPNFLIFLKYMLRLSILHISGIPIECKRRLNV